MKTTVLQVDHLLELEGPNGRRNGLLSHKELAILDFRLPKSGAFQPRQRQFNIQLKWCSHRDFETKVLFFALGSYC